MLDRVTANECLRAGREAYVRRPLPLILGCAVAAGLVVLFVVLFPSDLSWGLQLGVILSAPVLLQVQRSALKSLGEDESPAHRTRSSLRDWGSSFIAAAVIPTLFRIATWSIWFALPLTGALMYVFMTFGVADMFTSGRLDLLTSAVLFGSVSFMLTSGFLFAPICAVLDGIGPLEAIRRSLRMAGGHRKTILRIAFTCFWLPISLSLSAYFLSVLRTAAAVFRGLPAVLWIVSLVTVVLFYGPWFSGALMALFVPLKREEDWYVRRRQERRATLDLPQRGNRASLSFLRALFNPRRASQRHRSHRD
jgi:hypothetical protein